MKNFINLKDVSAKDLRKILNDAKRRKNIRKNLNNIDVNKDGTVIEDGTQIAAAGVQCPLSAQNSSINKKNCTNCAKSPWWKFWGKKKGCCNTNS